MTGYNGINESCYMAYVAGVVHGRFPQMYVLNTRENIFQFKVAGAVDQICTISKVQYPNENKHYLVCNIFGKVFTNLFDTQMKPNDVIQLVITEIENEMKQKVGAYYHIDF